MAIRKKTTVPAKPAKKEPRKLAVATEPVDQRRIDRAVLLLSTIENVRHEHHACTAREVARQAQLTLSLAHAQLTILRTRGHVAWTEVPGSLRVTVTGRAWLNKHR